MVSGKPPRHSKSKAEPVTIDLDAKDVKAISADVDAAKTDDRTSEKATTGEPGVSEQKPAATAAANPAPVWDQPHKTPIEPEPNVHKAEAAAERPQGRSPWTSRQKPFRRPLFRLNRCEAHDRYHRGKRLFLRRNRRKACDFCFHIIGLCRIRKRDCQRKTLDQHPIVGTGQALHAAATRTQTGRNLRPHRGRYRWWPRGARRCRQHAICRHPAVL